MIPRPTLALAALLLVAALPLPVAPLAAATGGSSPPGYQSYYAGDVEPRVWPVDEACCLVFNHLEVGEPSIGVNWASGNAFYQQGSTTYRVAFDDVAETATWTDVTPENGLTNVDPILFTDSQTGRTYAGGLDGTCSILSYTDDDGETWTPTGNSCVATLDHESIVSGPWRAAAPATLAPHPRAVYYCAQASFVTCMTSLDGGLTFAAPSQVSCGFSNPGSHGSLHIGPTGIVYLPFRNCGGQIGVAVSATNGVSWQGRAIPGTSTPSIGFDPDVATTKSGWLYAGYGSGTGGAFAALSKTNGSTWSTPVNIGAPAGVVTSIFHEAVAGDDSRAAVAFLGTTTSGDAFAQGFPGVWHLYVATTYNAGATWTTRQVSSDPVQRGWICANGINCPNGGTLGRNLLDFMDAQVDKEGRVLVAYVDGCVDACATAGGIAAQSTRAAAVITRQVSGDTLFAAYDGLLNALRSLPGGPYSGAEDSPIALSGGASGGAGGYSFAWSVDSAPAGSSAGPSSFSSTTAAAPTFTPDEPGTYTLRLTVTDSASATASATATLATLGAPPTGPILVDPSGDALAPGTDITSANVTGDTASEFTVELRIADLAASIPAAVNLAGISTGADTMYTVAFDHEETPGNLVSYQVAASQYAAGISANALVFELQVVGAGATSFVSPVASVAGIWDAENGVISWTVPRSIMVVRTAPTGANDPGVMTGGSPPGAGDALTGFSAEVRTWIFAGVGLGPGATVWDTAAGSGSYTFAN